MNEIAEAYVSAMTTAEVCDLYLDCFALFVEQQSVVFVDLLYGLVQGSKLP